MRRKMFGVRNIAKDKKSLKTQTVGNKKKKQRVVCFNVIRDIVPKNNIIINEFNERIIVLKCLSFNSLKYIVSNMSDFFTKEIEIFVYENEYYASLKLEKGIDKKKIKNVISELKLRQSEFYVLPIYEILVLARKKVFRQDEFKKSNYKLLVESKKLKKELQSEIAEKDVVIKDDCLYFNNDMTVKHVIFGLQMYPSILYDGFLSEFNYIKNVETTTYIKNINIDQVKININKEQNKIIYDYILDIDKLYNTCFFIHIWGNENEIIESKRVVLELANKYHVILNELFMQQKRAFCAFLPFMNNNIKLYRALSNINGILPFNEDVMEMFQSKMKYGKELITGNALFYERKTNGIILSSNRESKRKFIQDERNHVIVDLRLDCFVIDFIKKADNQNDYKIVFNNNDLKINNKDRFNLFRMYCLLCLGEYRESKTIEKPEREDLLSAIKRIEEKVIEYDFDKAKDMLFELIDRNKILTKKLNKYFYEPNETIKNYMNNIIMIYTSFADTKKRYIYIYNIQEIVNCLSLLCREIFNRKTSNLYLLSSYNDFILFNNKEISNEIFKSPYINIIDIKPNDLMFINNYLELSNKDIVHLQNKQNITGILYTNNCEFNYYIKREESDDI